MNSFSKCPLCKKKPYPDFFRLKSYWYCKACNLLWLKEFPKTDYGDMYYKGKSSLAQKLFIPIASFFHAIRRFYAGGGGKNLWVDVGAGEGGFLKTVRAKKRIGVEVSKSARKMIVKNGLDTLSDQEFLKTKKLRADVISFWHVLEHVENPWDYLNSAKKNLSKKGKIIIGVPNIDSFEFELTREYWFHLQPQFHLWHFSPRSIKKLLKQTGFKIESIDYWSIEHHLTGVLQSLINKSSQSKENVLHKLVKRGTGTSVLKGKDIFWSLFWLILGLPIVFLFWFFGALAHKSGTVVILASSLRKRV